MNGAPAAFAAGTVLGNMQIESATYNAKYGKVFAGGTIGLPKAEKNALVSEYGQTEMTVLPNGKTIVTDTPTMMDLPRDTVIYNEEETKKIMDNKVDFSGNSYASGTDSNSVPYQPTGVMADLMDFCKQDVKNLMKDIRGYAKVTTYEMQKQINDGIMERVNNVSNITTNNNNVQQPVTVQIGDIHLAGVQNVDGLAQGIKTRLPMIMEQEYFKR